MLDSFGQMLPIIEIVQRSLNQGALANQSLEVGSYGNFYWVIRGSFLVFMCSSLCHWQSIFQAAVGILRDLHQGEMKHGDISVALCLLRDRILLIKTCTTMAEEAGAGTEIATTFRKELVSMVQDQRQMVSKLKAFIKDGNGIAANIVSLEEELCRCLVELSVSLKFLLQGNLMAKVAKDVPLAQFYAREVRNLRKDLRTHLEDFQARKDALSQNGEGERAARYDELLKDVEEECLNPPNE